MPTNCSHCGAELIEGSKFCSVCGAAIAQPAATETQPPVQQQEEKENPSIALTPSKKPNKKMILGISLIAIFAVIVIAVIVILLSGTSPFTSADGRFVGEWQQNTIQGPVPWIFNNDGTLLVEGNLGIPTNTGTWIVNSNQLCIYNGTVCYTYDFSDNGDTLTLNRVGESQVYPANIVLTKKDLQGTDQTPDIECTTDSSSNRVIIVSIDPNVKWSDINISTNPVAKWQVQDAENQGLAKIDTTATISRFVSSGDAILVLETIGDISVTLTFIPTNEVLGNWIVNV